MKSPAEIAVRYGGSRFAVSYGKETDFFEKSSSGPAEHGGIPADRRYIYAGV